MEMIFSRYPCLLPEKEKMDIFIDNISSKMSYQLQLQCPPSFQKMIDNGIKIEEALIKRRISKFSKEGTSFSNNYNNNNKNANNNTHKSKFWMRNKNIINDGVVKIHNVKIKTTSVELISDYTSK